MLDQELSETIVSDMRCSGDSTQEYAAQRIEELESALSSTRAEADALEWWIENFALPNQNWFGGSRPSKYDRASIVAAYNGRRGSEKNQQG